MPGPRAGHPGRLAPPVMVMFATRLALDYEGMRRKGRYTAPVSLLAATGVSCPRMCSWLWIAGTSPAMTIITLYQMVIKSLREENFISRLRGNDEQAVEFSGTLPGGGVGAFLLFAQSSIKKRGNGFLAGGAVNGFAEKLGDGDGADVAGHAHGLRRQDGVGDDQFLEL